MASELKPFTIEDCSLLLAEMAAYFSQQGIFIDLGGNTNLNNDGMNGTDSANEISLEQFLIPPESAAPAFFLGINGVGDVETCLERLSGDLEKLHQDIANYAEQNSLEEEIRKKVTLINVHVSKAKGSLPGRAKKLITSCREKNSVGEQRREAASVLGKVFKERIMDGAMEPIYAERKSVYGFVLRKLNEFLANWGVQTLSLNVGDCMNYDLPCEILPGSEDGTVEQHDKIRKIDRFPYVWHEAREDKLPIWNGQVSVWR